ncbi:MAG: hypothetical protein K9H64_22690 [Bacteroidales bacterium]|nr:hypothetical protein [Bacteroidales bacterium]MCF8458847.1 hypothetical protein [Bacteroidales bacterium]
MNEFQIKYELLDARQQKQVRDFVDFLCSKKNSVKPFNMPAYKKRILNVSTWTEEETGIFNKNAKYL